MTTPRVDVLDTLRAFALLGVIVINSASFGYAFSSPAAGAVNPPGSLWAAVAHGAVVALFQNKSYPLLAFLLGYGIALQLRSRSRAAFARRRRIGLTLMALGFAHGLLLYFGDILLAYGAMSLILIYLMRLRLGTLVRVCKWLAVYVLLITASYGAFRMDAPQPMLAAAQTWRDALMINASTYGWVLSALPLDFLPLVTTFGLAGVIAGRLRWLEDARRWRCHWQRLARLALPWGLALNLANGLACGVFAYGGAYYSLLQQSVPTVAGPVLTAGVVGWFALRARRGTRLGALLAPVGRYTLSMYLSSSLVLMLALPAAGLGLGGSVGTVGTLAGALGLYGLWVVSAHVLARRGIAGPVERLLR